MNIEFEKEVFVLRIYRYENKYNSNNFTTDNNWLLIKVEVFDEFGNIILSHRGANLLADELFELSKKLKTRKPFELGTTEEVLTFSLDENKDGLFRFAITFWSIDDGTLAFDKLFTKDEIILINNEFNRLNSLFPVR